MHSSFLCFISNSVITEQSVVARQPPKFCTLATCVVVGLLGETTLLQNGSFFVNAVALWVKPALATGLYHSVNNLITLEMQVF